MWKNVLTFTKKGNDSITMERTKMGKWLYYYGTEGVHNSGDTFTKIYTTIEYVVRVRDPVFIVIVKLFHLK